VERDGRHLEEDEIERDRIGHRDIGIAVAVGVGAVGDGGMGLGRRAGADEPVVDRVDNGGVVGHRPDRRDPGAGGDRIVHVGIGEEQFPHLADADDEGDQNRSDERELDRADAALVATKEFHHGHCTLSDPVASMGISSK
jgi:hypothetical protein